jgi:hypothetical protein
MPSAPLHKHKALKPPTEQRKIAIFVPFHLIDIG